MAGYLERMIDRLLRDLLSDLPAVVIVGPRASGKTTTASRYAATIVRLDRPDEAAAFRADPDAALRGLHEPVLLDEWQMVPEALGAVKRAVDDDPRPGRFLLTGSVRAELDVPTWPGTGRLVRVPLYGMTVREQLGRLETAPLVDRLARGDDLLVPPDPPDLRGYVELALRGGFPEAALALSEPARLRWLESYVDQLLTRDVLHLAARRDQSRLRRFFEAYALGSAGVVEEKTLFEAAGINRKTALAYERLLTDLLVVEAIPAWTSNRLKRLVLMPKRYLVDPALGAGVLRLDANGVLRDAGLLGRILDTFVMAQIRSEIAVAETRPRLYHLRDHHGRHEIDVLAELAGGDVVAIEVKAGIAVGHEDVRHLRWLASRLEDRFRGGVVLYTGRRTYELGERTFAAPISTLWT